MSATADSSCGELSEVKTLLDIGFMAPKQMTRD
jgi:hypothetical protein